MTSSSVQQRRVDDLAAKRHKSEAHKAAVRLFDNKLIVEPADSNDEPLIFDAPNELIVGDASDSGDASSDTSGGGGDLWGLRRGFSSDNMYIFNAYLRRTVICGTPKKTFTHVL